MSLAAELAVLITVPEGIVPLLHQFTNDAFKETALDDLSSRDQRLPKAGKAPDIAIESGVGDRGETFIQRVSVVIEHFLAVTAPYRHIA
jgi:hypothetical protein